MTMLSEHYQLPVGWMTCHSGPHDVETSSFISLSLFCKQTKLEANTQGRHCWSVFSGPHILERSVCAFCASSLHTRHALVLRALVFCGSTVPLLQQPMALWRGLFMSQMSNRVKLTPCSAESTFSSLTAFRSNKTKPHSVISPSWLWSKSCCGEERLYITMTGYLKGILLRFPNNYD